MKQDSEKTLQNRVSKTGIKTILIAPCGMNCGLCRAYIRERNPCPGCRREDKGKPKTRLLCHIKNCKKRKPGKADYCFNCDDFPCPRLDHLDNRYRTRYGMSMVDNLRQIKQSGIRSFMRDEKKRWTCPGCGELLCVHEPRCLSCRSRWR